MSQNKWWKHLYPFDKSICEEFNQNSSRQNHVEIYAFIKSWEQANVQQKHHNEILSQCGNIQIISLQMYSSAQKQLILAECMTFIMQQPTDCLNGKDIK